MCSLQAKQAKLEVKFYKLSSHFHFYNNGRNTCLTILFKILYFIELLDLNSNSNSLFEISFIKDFLVDSSVNFLVDFDNVILYSAKLNIYIKDFFAWINPNKCAIFFFFYCLFPNYFIINISVFMFSFIDLYSSLWSGKQASTLQPITLHCSTIFSDANSVITFDKTDCSWVIIGSCCLNLNLVLKILLVLFYNPLLFVLIDFLLRIFYKVDNCYNFVILVFVFYTLEDIVM